MPCQQQRGHSVPELSQDPERVGRMEFMLTLRRRGISDQAVLRAMDEVPREHFVAPDFADAAYADHALPIACGQTISQPYVVAYMTEQLARRAAPSRARGRHRLRISGRGAVAPGARGGQHRALPHLGGSRAQPAAHARLRQCRGGRGRRIRRRAGSRALRPHHRHRGGRGRCPKRWSSSLPKVV